jgi:hypothetical protein
MRVLIVSIPQAGHLTPLLPLATAFAVQGDELLVATGRDVADQVSGAGLRLAAAGAGLGEWFRVLAGRIRGLPGDGLPTGRILPGVGCRRGADPSDRSVAGSAGGHRDRRHAQSAGRCPAAAPAPFLRVSSAAR